MLGLSTRLTKSRSKINNIVTDNLILRHKYGAGSVHPLGTGAARFVRSNTDSISLGVGTALTPKTTGFTACFWIKVNTPATSPGEMGLACDNGTNQRMYIGNHNGDWDFGLGDTAWTSGTATVTTEWTHLALTYTTGDVAQLYINGVKDRTDSGFGAFNDGTFGSDFYIGQHGTSTPNYNLDGYVCNVGIWTKALTQGEVRSIMLKNYEDLNDREKTSMLSWWNLDSTISEDYAATSETDGDPSSMTLTLDNHDTTLTEVTDSVTNSDFTSGSGTTITGWDNENSQWTRVNDTVVSGTTSKLLEQNMLTNNIAHKVIVRAKNTTTDSTAQLRVYIGANNYATHNLTNDFAEYTFHGLQTNDVQLSIYNASNTNVTIDWIKVYKYDGNIGALI